MNSCKDKIGLVALHRQNCGHPFSWFVRICTLKYGPPWLPLHHATTQGSSLTPLIDPTDIHSPHNTFLNAKNRKNRTSPYSGPFFHQSYVLINIGPWTPLFLLHEGATERAMIDSGACATVGCCSSRLNLCTMIVKVYIERHLSFWL